MHHSQTFQYSKDEILCCFPIRTQIFFLLSIDKMFHLNKIHPFSKNITHPPLDYLFQTHLFHYLQTNKTRNRGDPAGEYQREARGAEAPWILHGSNGSMESSDEDQNPRDLEPGMMLIWVFPKMVVPNNHGFSYY